MDTEAGILVKRNIPRPDAATLKEFADTPCGMVADANRNRGALDHRIQPVVPVKAPWVGPALTVQGPPDDNLAIYAAIRMAEPGDVIICATDNFTGSAITGGNGAGYAKNKGVVAMVTDSLVRDLGDIAKTGLPVYGAGVSPNSPQRNGPVRVGFPVMMGGMTIKSGDLVVGDEEGVVIVPREHIPMVVKALEAVRAKEATGERRIRDGKTEPPWFDDAMEKLGVRYVD